MWIKKTQCILSKTSIANFLKKINKIVEKEKMKIRGFTHMTLGLLSALFLLILLLWEKFNSRISTLMNSLMTNVEKFIIFQMFFCLKSEIFILKKCKNLSEVIN